MKKICTAIVLLTAFPAWAAARPAGKSIRSSRANATPPATTKPCKTGAVVATGARGKTAAPKRATATKPATKSTSAAKASAPRIVANEVAKPGSSDPDRERVLQLQEALDGIVHGKVLGRLHVGMRVEGLSSGRTLYGWRSGALMDPASNQKVLGTTAALLRLGSDYRYRTEVTGSAADVSGTVHGDLVLRGNGDPSLRPRHLDELAERLTKQGITAVEGDVLGDGRRIGSDEITVGRPPLRVGGTSIEVHVRPSDKPGSRPLVSIRPASDLFTVVNQAETRAKGRASVSVGIERVGHRLQITVGGRVSMARGEAVIRRTLASAPLFAAFLFREALIKAGIQVKGGVGLESGDTSPRLSSGSSLQGSLLALATSGGDTLPALANEERQPAKQLLAIHESEPLAQLLRRVNKDSDNEWAERVLETVGAEVLGGAATTAKGVRVLRETLAELGLPAGAYSPSNGSGLGHQNRVTAAGMAALLRHIYFDPRIGPELTQSLSVGGVDGTTRNRFRGSLAAHRVRAKTGTLNGVSCLSGFVGDGSDVLVFSILVEGHRRRAVPSVRAAQVGAVNAMMRFVRGTAGPLPDEASVPNTDLESGEEQDQDGTDSHPDGFEGMSSEPNGKSELEHSIPHAP